MHANQIGNFRLDVANVMLSLGLLVYETNIHDSTRMTMMAGTFILIHQPLCGDLRVFEELAIHNSWYFF